MNKFDRAVNKQINEMILKNFAGTEVDEKTYKKYAAIAKASVRVKYRGVKPSNNPKSLYRKMWKNAESYSHSETSAT